MAKQRKLNVADLSTIDIGLKLVRVGDAFQVFFCLRGKEPQARLSIGEMNAHINAWRAWLDRTIEKVNRAREHRSGTLTQRKGGAQ